MAAKKPELLALPNSSLLSLLPVRTTGTWKKEESLSRTYLNYSIMHGSEEWTLRKRNRHLFHMPRYTHAATWPQKGDFQYGNPSKPGELTVAWRHHWTYSSIILLLTACLLQQHDRSCSQAYCLPYLTVTACNSTVPRYTKNLSLRHERTEQQKKDLNSGGCTCAGRKGGPSNKQKDYFSVRSQWILNTHVYKPSFNLLGRDNRVHSEVPLFCWEQQEVL
jgi:hypothetical protein